MKSEKQRHHQQQQQQYKNCFYNILNARITGAIIHTLSIIRKEGKVCEREEEADRIKRIGK